MRTLKFIVTGQVIRPDQSCDFSGLVPGTSGYLKAGFSFDEDWKGCEKIVEFRRYLSDDPESIRLVNDACMIPEESLTRNSFKVSVIGIRPGYRIKTGNAEVKQDG